MHFHPALARLPRAARLPAFAGLLALALPLAGCIGGGAPAPTLAAMAPLPPDEALSITIEAPAPKIQRAIVARARARGTSGSVADSRTVVLERALPATPPSLAAMCGPQTLGRIVRIVVTTDEDATGRTAVVERRFIVDHGANPCVVKLSASDIESGNRSLQELKAQVETASARR